jgi:site-specific DNA recombinase
MIESEKASLRAIKRLRCAIYTRKSTDEGLEKDFNSLDAQREACAAFIQSQKHEGWIVLPTLYDDGCWQTSRRAASMWWSSTRWTA